MMLNIQFKGPSRHSHQNSINFFSEYPSNKDNYSINYEYQSVLYSEVPLYIFIPEIVSFKFLVVNFFQKQLSKLLKNECVSCFRDRKSHLPCEYLVIVHACVYTCQARKAVCLGLNSTEFPSLSGAIIYNLWVYRHTPFSMTS